MSNPVSSSMTVGTRRALALILLAFLAVSPAIAENPSEPQDRVVAIGDVHGAHDSLVAILQETGLIDDTLGWSGGTATLVQIGDVFDRGAHVRQVLDLLMRLQSEAQVAGGRVICLLGNHEVMNLMGTRRDANPEVYAAFADAGSGERRDAAYDQVTRCWTRRATAFGQAPPLFNRRSRSRWRELYPLGAVEYVAALEPEGVYGRWLRTLPVAVVLNGTLFIHGGIGPELRGLAIDEINRRVADEIASFDRMRSYLLSQGLAVPTASVSDLAKVASQLREVATDPASGPQGRELLHHSQEVAALNGWMSWLANSADGPLWFRGAAYWDDRKRHAEMLGLLRGVSAERMVVGHTVMDSASIVARFRSRVFLIDTGMLSSHYEGGRASALELAVDGSVAAVYLGDRQVLVGPSVSVRAPGVSE